MVADPDPDAVEDTEVKEAVAVIVIVEEALSEYVDDEADGEGDNEKLEDEDGAALVLLKLLETADSAEDTGAENDDEAADTELEGAFVINNGGVYSVAALKAVLDTCCPPCPPGKFAR